MEILSLKKIKSRSSKIIKTLESPSQTQNFLNPANPEILELCGLLSLQNDSALLYQKLKQVYIKQQTNEDLEYFTLLAGYLNGKFSQCLFLAQDLLVTRHTAEVFYVILKICVNKLSLGEMALHYSALSLELNPNQDGLKTARAVVCIYNASSCLYQQGRVKLLREAKELLNVSHSTGRNGLFYKGIVHAQLKELDEALACAAEGLRITMESNYAALLALVMLAQEDFTGAIAVAKRGLKATPFNLLIYSVKLYCKFLMFEHTHDKEPLKKSIKCLIRMCRENANESNSSATGAIKEESSNVDSAYLEDIFKDIIIEGNENLQQIAKMCFKIAWEIGEFDLAEKIFPVISDNKIESAIVNFKKTGNSEDLENFIEDLWACEVFSQAKYEIGDKNSAISICKQAIKLNENSKKSWMLLGKIYQEKGFLDDAMDAFLSALKSVPVNFAMIPIYLEDF